MSKTKSRGDMSDVEFSNLEKVLFPATGTTKGEVIRYYLEIAPFLVPHFRDRPVTLIRMPNGVRGKTFFEKNAPGHTPEWVRIADVPRTEGGVIHYVVIDDARTLAWCANLAALELHPFLHRASDLRRPTHLAFDLDPGQGADLLACIEVAFLIRDFLGRLGLECFPKVSGSKGLQLYLPLNTPATYDEATPFAKAVAELLEREHSDLIVSAMPKALRTGKVLIDWSQNHEKKTTVGVYSLRGKRDAPFVSQPVRWEELARARKAGSTDALQFPPEEALRRARRWGDLFEPVLKLRQKLPAEFVAAAGRATRRPASLRRYREKRDFTVTPEPAPEAPTRSAQGSRGRFVIQKHAASHLHYDFRLELDDVLKSWAIPKGVSTEAGVKHSAFQVEDHPLDYLEFEGTIPKGQYGDGTVMVWDIGTYDLMEGDVRSGRMKLWLTGRKLKGEWNLFRIRSERPDRPVWLIVKAKESAKPMTAKQESTSAVSGRTMEEIAEAGDAVWQSGRAEHPQRQASRQNGRAKHSHPRRQASRAKLTRLPRARVRKSAKTVLQEA